MPPAAVWLARIFAIAVACYGICAFVRMNMGTYLLGQAQFAFADFSAPLALLFVRYAAIAVLVTNVFYCVGRIVSKNRSRFMQEAYELGRSL